MHHILDDTGSELLELYEDDCGCVGLTPTYGGMLDSIWIDAASDTVPRESCSIEVQLLDNEGTPIGPILYTPSMRQQ
jgi:hypothetical protein